MKKKKKRVARFLTCVFIILIIGAGLYIAYKKFWSKSDKPLDNVKNYNYTIESRDTKLMKDNFDLLKEVLQAKDVDYEKYAEYLGKLFVIDLYTLDNKDNKYDIGGAEYVYPENVNNYKLKVQDTLYKYLENITDRKQDLPVVSEIELDSIEKKTYEYRENEYDAFELVLSWDYAKDYGYDDKATVTLMKVDNFLYVVEFNPEVES